MKIEATIVDGRILAKAGPIKGRPGLVLAPSKVNPRQKRWQLTGAKPTPVKDRTFSSSKTIFKELEPLAIEAQKYENAKEFYNALHITKGRYAYKRFSGLGVKILDKIEMPHLKERLKRELLPGDKWVELFNSQGKYKLKAGLSSFWQAAQKAK